MSKDASESYLHYYAKEVLISWLRHSQGKFFSLRWNPFGSRVYPEYPLLLVDHQASHGLDETPFDEIPSKLCECPVLYENLLLSSAINPCSHRFGREDHIPSRLELLARGHRVGAIVDVVIADEGRLKYLFEIVHTSGLTPMKKRLLCDYALRHQSTVYLVDANYLLRQVSKPKVWRGVKVIANRPEPRRWKLRSKRRKSSK